MEPTMIAVLTTSILNLIVALRNSRCTDIQSECCCCSLQLHRDVPHDEEEPVNASKP